MTKSTHRKKNSPKNFLVRTSTHFPTVQNKCCKGAPAHWTLSAFSGLMLNESGRFVSLFDEQLSDTSTHFAV